MEYQLLIFGIWVTEVLHSSPNQPKKSKDQVRRDSSRNTTSNKDTQNQTKVPIHHDNLELSNVDEVSSNAKSSQFGAMLCIFEDNEAVIIMNIKGRSPTMRHVQNPQSVALDWLFDRINLDSKIQTKYIYTKHKLADVLTKRNFTRDEWNNLLHLINISHFKLSLLLSEFQRDLLHGNDGEKDARTKRTRSVAKSKSTAMKVKADVELGLTGLDKFFDSARSDKSLRILKATCQNDWTSAGRLGAREFQSRRSVVFSSVAKRCSSGCKYEETRSDRRRPGTLEFL